MIWNCTLAINQVSDWNSIFSLATALHLGFLSIEELRKSFPRLNERLNDLRFKIQCRVEAATEINQITNNDKGFNVVKGIYSLYETVVNSSNRILYSTRVHLYSSLLGLSILLFIPFNNLFPYSEAPSLSLTTMLFTLICIILMGLILYECLRMLSYTSRRIIARKSMQSKNSNYLRKVCFFISLLGSTLMALLVHLTNFETSVRIFVIFSFLVLYVIFIIKYYLSKRFSYFINEYERIEMELMNKTW